MAVSLISTSFYPLSHSSSIDSEPAKSPPKPVGPVLVQRAAAAAQLELHGEAAPSVSEEVPAGSIIIDPVPQDALPPVEVGVTDMLMLKRSDLQDMMRGMMQDYFYGKSSSSLSQF